MNRIKAAIAGLGAFAALVSVVPALAQEAEYKAIEAKNLASGKHTISADKGYILITGQARANGLFIKTPDAEEQATFQAEWEKEFAEEVDKYPRRLKRWEEDVAARRRAGDKPVEPKRETFSIGDIERRMVVSFGPQFVFEKGEGSYSYLVEVEPGTYTYYGPLFYMPNGAAMGTCFCMGSVKFEVGAGKIANLGTFLSMGWADDAAIKASSVVAIDTGRVAQPVEFPVPAALTDKQVEPADLRAAGKMNNFFGILVGRIPPVEGVIAYERDRIVDVKERNALQAREAASAAAANAAASTEVAAETSL